MLRQPIVAVLGHVDHGKTLLLDKIRGSAIASREAGGITQAIGASIIPLETLKKICGNLLDALKINLTIPGLLLIDTPGHAAFVNLRRRGGNLADIAVLVIDINEGLMPQTVESIDILRQYKTPFVIALNKIDLIQGWKFKGESLLNSIASQQEMSQKKFETLLYTIVGKLFENKIEADRFDRVSDYTKQVAIIPVSAKTGEGIPELLMMITGLAQRYLESSLKFNVQGPARGTIIEVKEQKGVGTVLDTILFDGSLSVGDSIVIGNVGGAVCSRVKALFLPAALAEMREKKTAFASVKQVHASTGVRIVSPGTENVVAGTPLCAVGKGDVEQLKIDIQKEVDTVIMDTDAEGIIVKADTLGSLEALCMLCHEHGIPVRRAAIGPVSKSDIADAESASEKNPVLSVILGFNIPKPEPLPEKVTVLANDIIYRLLVDYDSWVEAKKRAIELAKLDSLVKPAKIMLLNGYVFRQSNPAVVGVEILLGKLKTLTPLMNADGKALTIVKGIQLEQENLSEAKRGQRIAISMPDVIVGRQIKEGDILYSAISEQDFREYKEFKDYLSKEEKELLKEIAVIMRKNNLVWGV